MKNKNIFQSIKCAYRGIKSCFKQERNFKEYTVIALIFLLINILLAASPMEYIVFISLVCVTFSAEFINTAIERIIDKNANEINEQNKFIKDAAAAGVLISSVAFFISEGIILIPKLVAKLS